MLIIFAFVSIFYIKNSLQRDHCYFFFLGQLFSGMAEGLVVQPLLTGCDCTDIMLVIYRAVMSQASMCKRMRLKNK